jgi:hypothetical protein
MTTNSLVYFRVDGSWRDVEQPLPSSVGSIAPQENPTYCYVDFYPGTDKVVGEGGMTFLVPSLETYGDTELSIAPITGRALGSTLRSITRGDPVGVELLSNAPWMLLGQDLYYHVRYRNVTYGGALQRFSPFAFKAPTDSTPVLLTSRSLPRFDYYGP